MKHLPLTFPTKGRCVALACANGLSLRYEVQKIMTGEWQLVIDGDYGKWETLRALQFASEREAKTFARDDFRRRQLVRLAA